MLWVLLVSDKIALASGTMGPLADRPPRTLADLAREALTVQDACNLSGVAHGFSRAMTDLRRLGMGTDECNRHPIAVLWADKIAHLTGTQRDDGTALDAAYGEVQKLIVSDQCGRCGGYNASGPHGETFKICEPCATKEATS